MKWNRNSFGGFLLETSTTGIAVNGGGSLAEMERAYIVGGKKPRALILTSEHLHRSGNVVNFCRKHHVPLITTPGCAQRLPLEGIDTLLLGSSDCKLFLRLGIGIAFMPVRYDSIEPFCFMIQDDKDILGIIPDGRILPGSVPHLLECDVLLLDNVQRIPEKAPSALKLRLKSVYNTRREIGEIFKDFTGKVVCV